MSRPIFAIIFVAFAITSYAQKDWKLEKTKGNIKAYIKDSGKAYKMYKVNYTVNAPVDQVMKKYADIASHSQWMNSIAKSEIKSTTSANELVSYYEIALPWPMENRDAVYRLDKVYDAPTQTTFYNFKAIPTSYPTRKGFIRIKVSEGYWSFKKIDDKTTFVETSSYTETDGIAPFMVNAFIIDGPIKTFENFAKFFQK